MASNSRTALALVPDALNARLQAALLRAGVTLLVRSETADGPTALTACAESAVRLVALSQRSDGTDAEVTRLLRSLGFPVLLLSGATNPVQVNASRKAVGATAALGGSFSDDDLLAAVKTLAPPDAVPVERPPVKLPPSTKASETDPAWTLARYCMRRSTGFIRLVAANGTAEVTVHLSDGTPVSAVSNVRGTRLGEILVRNGKVTAEQVERAMRVVERKGVRLGSVLVDQGVVSRDDILREVRGQYVSRIQTAFAWPAIVSHVRFEPIPEDDAPITLSREALFLEGLRRSYDVIRLKALVPLDAVYEFTKDAHRRFAAFGFSAPEVAVLAGIDGNRPASALVVRTANPRDALRALVAAYCLDLIRPKGQA